MLREIAWIELDREPPAEEQEALMHDDEFDQEMQMAAEGRWEELDLDPIPEDFTMPATIEDLRHGDG